MDVSGQRSHGLKVKKALSYAIEREQLNWVLEEATLEKLAKPVSFHGCSIHLEPLSASSAYALGIKGTKVPVHSLAMRNVFLVLGNWRMPFQMQIPYMQTYIIGWQQHDMLRSVLAEKVLTDKIIEINGEYTPLTNTIIARETSTKTQRISSRALLQAATQPPPHYRNFRYALASLLDGGTVEYNEVKHKLIFISLHQGLICLKVRTTSRQSSWTGVRVELPFGNTSIRPRTITVFKADILVPSGFTPYIYDDLTLPRVIRDVNINVNDLALMGINTDELEPKSCLNGIVTFVTEYSLAGRDVNTSIMLLYIDDVLSGEDLSLLNFYKIYYYIATTLSSKCLNRIVSALPTVLERIRSMLGDAARALYTLNTKYAAETLDNTIRELSSLDCVINSLELERFDPDAIPIGPRYARRGLSSGEPRGSLALRLRREDIYDFILRLHCSPQPQHYRCPNPYLAGLRHVLEEARNTLSRARELSPQVLRDIHLKLICINRFMEDRSSLMTLGLEKIKLTYWLTRSNQKVFDA